MQLKNRIPSLFFLFLFCCLGLLEAQSSPAEAQKKYAALPNKWVQEVQAKKLWQAKAWLRLLHYQKRNFGGYKSAADNAQFFIDQNVGRKNPQAELWANLHALHDEREVNLSDQSFICRFPLRAKWLVEQVEPTNFELRFQACDRMQKWLERLGASGASLIFAGSYLGNPASMFGHTFLRIHRRKNGRLLPDLLHYTVNFAADTGDEGGLLYTVKGLVGAYPGLFSTFPYYLKIQEYGQIESRDLWEYRLNLSETQIENLSLHLWEMGQAVFRYYFVDENCSYFLLSLLNVLEPETDFLKPLPFFTTPVDTLKVLAKHSDWLEEVELRPSLLAKFKQNYRAQSLKTRRETQKILRSKQAVETLRTQPVGPASLNLLSDYLAYREKGKIESDLQEEVLLQLSRLPTIESGVKQSEKQNEEKTGNPILSHPSMRLGLGGGSLERQKYFSLYFRGAYHDLLNRQAGFVSTAQIEGLNGKLRLDEADPDPRLEYLDVVRVVSLTPIQALVFKPSWNVAFGLRSRFHPTCGDCLAGYLEGGPGLALGRDGRNRRVVGFVLANAFFDANPANAIGFRWGAKPEAGLLWDFGGFFSAKLSGFYEWAPGHDMFQRYGAAIESAFHFSSRLELRLGATWDETLWRSEGVLFWYF